mgnify:CR=1 FL=1
MNGQRTSSKAHPYSIDEIPKFNIDYKGMINYAKRKKKKVVELSDSEKELFTNGSSMSEIRKKSIKL